MYASFLHSHVDSILRWPLVLKLEVVLDLHNIQWCYLSICSESLPNHFLIMPHHHIWPDHSWVWSTGLGITTTDLHPHILTVELHSILNLGSDGSLYASWASIIKSCSGWLSRYQPWPFAFIGDLTGCLLPSGIKSLIYLNSH